MDGLWDPPNYQAKEDSRSFSLPYGDPLSHCFTEPVDVIEDTAINESCCIQVLEILTSKADTEILEYEEELMDLLSQLACTDEVFSDMLLMSLRAKIEFLDSSIRKSNEDAEAFWSTTREPAESIYDILKSIFSDYTQKKDLQFADNTRTASSSSCQVPADTRKKLKTVNITPVKKQTISQTIVKVEEEDTSYPHTTHVPLYWGSKNKTFREVSKFQIRRPVIMKKDIIQNRTPRSNSICPKPSLETEGKRKHQLSIIKSQTYDESMSLATVPYDKSMSLATVPYDESMSLSTVPYEESMSLETVPYDENMSLATVPYIESSEETNAMSLATIPYVESHEEANAKQPIIQELDFPPGYPKPQHHQKQSISRSMIPYSTRTYTRRKKPNSSFHKSSSSRLALVLANPLDRVETYSNMYMEDYYTVSDLRDIAKHRNLKGYYKLRKAELAEFLGIKLIVGRKKQPKKRETQLLPVKVIKCEP